MSKGKGSHASEADASPNAGSSGQSIVLGAGREVITGGVLSTTLVAAADSWQIELVLALPAAVEPHTALVT